MTSGSNPGTSSVAHHDQHRPKVVVYRRLKPAGNGERDMMSGSADREAMEKRWAGRLLIISTASAVFWLLHSFAVRSLIVVVRHSASKLGR